MQRGITKFEGHIVRGTHTLIRENQSFTLVRNGACSWAGKICYLPQAMLLKSGLLKQLVEALRVARLTAGERKLKGRIVFGVGLLLLGFLSN